MPPRRHSTVRLIAVVAFSVCTFAAPFAAYAQSYPAKPIRVVVPNPAGGIDVYMRVMLPRMMDLLGQSVVIENRAGASGAIGAENIARSAPDGYSLLFATSAVLVTSPFLNKNLPYDPIKDFTPISKILAPVEVIAVHASLPVGSVKQLLDYARRNPGKLSYGSSGVGSIPHFDGEAFKAAAGVDLLHVPYKGVAQIVPELAAGRIDVAFPGIGAVRSFVAAGKVKVLAVLDSNRFQRLPDVPSVSETLPGFRAAPLWFSLYGPAGLPRPVVDRLHAVIVKSLNDPEIRTRYESGGFRVIGSTPEELVASMKADAAFTAQLVKSIGIKAD